MKTKLFSKKQQGFTLIEILVVVALIAILAAITFVAINPARIFRDTRNSTRKSDVSAMLNAISTYLTKDPNTIATLETAAGTTLAVCDDATTPFKNIGSGTNNVNLAAALVPTYIGSMPKDPSGGTDADTGYDICKVQNAGVDTGSITIQAPNSVNDGLSPAIKLTR